MWRPNEEGGDQWEAFLEQPVEDTFNQVQICATNYASLAKHIGDLDSLAADIIVCSETRLSAEEKASVEHRLQVLQVLGYNMVAATARRVDGKITAEGVAVVVRNPLRAAPIVLPSNLKRWSDAGRLVVVKILFPGSGQLHLVAHYAHADQDVNREHQIQEVTLMQEIAEWKISQGSQGMILMGDFNSQPGEAVYEAAMETGVWHDAIDTYMQERPPTFYNHRGASTIDHILADQMALSWIHEAGVSSDSTSQHRPLWVMAHVPIEQAHVTPVMPKFHIAAIRPAPAELQKDWRWRHMEYDLVTAIRARQVRGCMALLVGAMRRAPHLAHPAVRRCS